MILTVALDLCLCLLFAGAGAEPAAAGHGDDTVDRVLAVDTMTVNVIALLALYGATWPLAMTASRPTLLFAMTGFVSDARRGEIPAQRGASSNEPRA
jgi:multisubunit Na+/H+ antiporter MnhF subunit